MSPPPDAPAPARDGFARWAAPASPDTTPREFETAAQLDTYASFLMHPHLTQLLSIAHDTPLIATRRALLDRMSQL